MSGMVGNLEKMVAAKMAGSHPQGPQQVPSGWTQGQKTGWKGGTMPPGLAKKGTFQVETQGLVSRKMPNKGAAMRRTSRETQVYNQGGFGKGKAPEMTMQPKGSTAVARFPSGQPVPRGRF